MVVVTGKGSIWHLTLYYGLILNCNAKDGNRSASSLVRGASVCQG